MKLRTEHLSRQIDGKILVNDISIEVPDGDILAIVGPSGAGKSSFLRLINRLDEPTSGTVYLDQLDYFSIPPRQLRRRVGMVMQQPFLFPGTVADNLRFGPAQQGKKIPQESIHHLLERVDLAGYADRAVNNLSGGEAQRVSIARTLANSPEVLLLDEPTSALDEAAKEHVESLLLSILNEQSLTCLIVTHDMAQAARIARRVMVLEHGQLVRIGPVGEVLNLEPESKLDLL